MTEILQMFTGNPLSTFIGKKIEAATRPELESDDWALNLEICDMINENDDDAKDAVRAIKKRLQQIEQDRNFIITNRALTVLETCVSNCSRRFHVLVMTKDFIQDLVKLIGPKNNPPIDLQERVLRLIERWAEAFRAQPDLGGVVAVYNDLKAKGVTFPPRDPNSNVPIQTPQRSVPPQQASPPPTTRSDSMSATRNQDPPPAQPPGPIVLEGEGYSKISQDLGVVQSSIDMFNDIMRLLESSSDESDWQLAADLNTTCRQMKERIVDLIARVANEDLTIELLRLNDDLNNIFVKYDRLVKNRTKLQQTSATAASATSNNPPPSSTTARISPQTENELSLIDFNAEDSANNREPKTTTTSATTITTSTTTTVVDPFDSSAVAEALSKSSKPSSSSNQRQQQVEPLAENLNRLSLGASSGVAAQTDAKKLSGLPEEISSVREQDFAEIENWLSSDSGRNLTSIGADMPSIEPISIPNSEFENFIATRAMAGSSATTSSSQQTKSTKSQNPKPEPSV